jgi:hypothetical protein
LALTQANQNETDYAARSQAGQILINHDRRLLTVVVRSIANLG